MESIMSSNSIPCQEETWLLAVRGPVSDFEIPNVVKIESDVGPLNRVGLRPGPNGATVRVFVSGWQEEDIDLRGHLMAVTVTSTLVLRNAELLNQRRVQPGITELAFEAENDGPNIPLMHRTGENHQPNLRAKLASLARSYFDRR